MIDSIAAPAAAPAAAQGAAKVKLIGASKRYVSGFGKDGKHFYAVKDINLEVADGEFVCIVGPTGCGKSTLLNMIAGFEKPDEGQVLFEGQPVQAAGPDRLVIFQEHGLFPWLTVQQNVEFGLRVLGLSKKERRDRAMHYLKMVHLQKFRRSYPFQLSGGMKQRTAIARALAVEPRMLLMDEPFGALDPRTRDRLHLELQSLWIETKKTIFFITHSVEEAVRLSDRIIIMGSQPGTIRKIFKVTQSHPRDFLDPVLNELRATILQEFEDEWNRLLNTKESDDDVSVEKTSVRGRARGRVDLDMGDGI